MVTQESSSHHLKHRHNNVFPPFAVGYEHTVHSHKWHGFCGECVEQDSVPSFALCSGAESKRFFEVAKSSP